MKIVVLLGMILFVSCQSEDIAEKNDNTDENRFLSFPIFFGKQDYYDKIPQVPAVPYPKDEYYKPVPVAPVKPYVKPSYPGYPHYPKYKTELPINIEISIPSVVNVPNRKSVSSIPMVPETTRPTTIANPAVSAANIPAVASLLNLSNLPNELSLSSVSNAANQLNLPSLPNGLRPSNLSNMLNLPPNLLNPNRNPISTPNTRTMSENSILEDEYDV